MSDIVERLNALADVGDQGRKPDPTCPPRQAAAEITRLRDEVERLRGLGQFLVARIDELDWCDWDRHTNDWNGHVDPALDRFRAALDG